MSVSKEQSLADYLKKCSDPAYISKVIGGGIIFKKAQSKESWKKRTYYIKDDKRLLYFYYGGKAKPPLGMLNVTSALLAVGPADNIKKSGAIRTDAVSITLSLAHESADNNNKHLVFETTSEAKKFALMLSYTCKNSNVTVFAQMMDWGDLEEACAVINGNSSTRKFLDVDKCTEKAQLEGELVKYEDELEDYEHKQRLYSSIKAQNAKTKTNDETFEVLQANLLLPLVEQRVAFLKKRQQEVNTKYLEMRSFVAGVEKAKSEQEVARTPPPPRSGSSVASSVSSGNSSPTGSLEGQSREQSQAGGTAAASGGGARMKSFRRLLSISRSKSTVGADGSSNRSPSKENEHTNSQSKIKSKSVVSSSNRPPPPPPRPSQQSSPGDVSPENDSSDGNSGGSSSERQINSHSTPVRGFSPSSSPSGGQSSFLPGGHSEYQPFDSPSPSLGKPRRLSATPHHPPPSPSPGGTHSFPQSSQQTPERFNSINSTVIEAHNNNASAAGSSMAGSSTSGRQVSLLREREQGRKIVGDETHIFAAECLRTMKSFVPLDMMSSGGGSAITHDMLVKNLGSVKLAERIMKKKILWIIHLTIREIERIPDRDLAAGGKYSARGQNLDLVELGAVYAVLPGSFRREVDASGAKEAWRRDIEDRLLDCLQARQDETLTSDELRHEAYTSALAGQKWQERASLDAKLHHMASLLQVIKVDCCEGGGSKEAAESNFEQLVALQKQLTALMDAKPFKSVAAAKKAAKKIKKKIASRREEV